jgi:hypothetical protein
VRCRGPTWCARGLAGVLFGLAATAPAPARPPERPALRAHPRGEAEITLDGRLDEPIWAAAPVGTDFVERSPSPGAPAPPGHEVRILYDRDALYVGVRLPLDAAAGETPRALEMRRDDFGIFNDDAVSLKIDVRADRRTTVGFVTNAAGTQVDYISLENGKQFRREYDGVWAVKTHVAPDAWTAEFRLPATVLGVPASDAPRVIGFNVTRDHSSRAATYDWSEVPPEFGPFSALYYGDIVGLDELGGGRPLTLIPYVAGGYSGQLTAPTRDEGDIDAGGDVQLRLLEDLWSELTLNPDFAQVDLDDPVVNFDRFPLFFPERRPFFLTGLQVFDFGVPGESQLFFSRRIGLDDEGDEIRVLTGLKLYGSEGPWQVGLFQVFTDNEEPDSARATDDDEALEEAASWSIARLRYNFGEAAHLGVLGTFRSDISVFGTRDVPALPKGAVGLDGTLRLIDRRLAFEGFWAYANNTVESAPAEEGHSAQAKVAWSGSQLQPYVAVLLVDRDFDPAVGFVRRRGIIQADAVFDYVRRPRPDQDLQIELGVAGQAIQASDRDENLGYSTTLDGALRWRSGWRVAASAAYREDVVEEAFELFGRRTIDPGRYRGVRASVTAASPSVRNPFLEGTYEVDTSFFDGVRHGPSLLGAFSLGPLIRSVTTAGLSFSQFDDGFSADAFTLNTRLTVAPSTQLTQDTIVQVNTIAESTTTLLRLRWRYYPGSDLFVVGRYQLDWGDDRRERLEITAKIQFRYDLLL